MEFLLEIFFQREFMMFYHLVSFAAGIFLCVGKKEDTKWHEVLVGMICVVNGFLWGSMFLFQKFFHGGSFWAGGLLGALIMLGLMRCGKNMKKYLLCIWCAVKMYLIIGNCIMYRIFGECTEGQPYVEEGREEILFNRAAMIGLALGVLLLVIRMVVYAMKKEINISWSRGFKGISFLYGSCVVTGCIYEFYYDRTVEMRKFLSAKEEYVNFYKTILRVDWAGHDTQYFFVGVCVFVLLVSMIWQMRRRR
ncbi:MAG: hypothetical protein NC293_06145 [Roseburia sp.]|nr:hypothetical protein [Roseburia sp.]